MQEHLPLPVNEQGLALCVNGEQKQAIRADAQISELSQTLEWQCRPSGLVQVRLQCKANRVKTCLNGAGQKPLLDNSRRLPAAPDCLRLITSLSLLAGGFRLGTANLAGLRICSS